MTRSLVTIPWILLAACTAPYAAAPLPPAHPASLEAAEAPRPARSTAFDPAAFESSREEGTPRPGPHPGGHHE